MLTDISDVVFCENRERTEQIPVGLTSFDSRLGTFPILNRPVAEFTFENRENRKLLIHCVADVRVAVPCGRCLTEVPTDIHLVSDRELSLEEGTVREEEMEDISYLSGWNLDADRLIYGELLMNWPAKVLCKQDCRGICRVCGQNLNEGDCGCEKTERDPRMAAIQDIFNKFKEV